MTVEVKRQREINDDNDLQKKSKLFSHFRAIGMVTNHVPASLGYMGGKPYLTTCVGSSFQIFDTESLNICFVSKSLDAPIRSLRTSREFTAAVCDNGSLHSFESARLLKSTFLPQSVTKFVRMDIFGEKMIILFENEIYTISFPTLEGIEKIESTSRSCATCFAHPITYLNKIIVGFEDGKLQLLNVNTQRLIYSFRGCSFKSSISFIEPSPVIDIVAVGLVDGSVWICDVKKDRKLFSLQHSADSKVSGISFRNDIKDSSQLVVGLSNGRAALWNLNDRKLLGYWQAHEDDEISMISFLLGQPIIVTTGNDNAVNEWIIENEQIRLLKSRSGHSLPPKIIKFYDNGNAIISASDDKSLRLISLVKDSQSTEISQGSIQSISKKIDFNPKSLKFNPTIALDVFLTKDLKWDNAVTAHEQSHIARTWRVDHRRVGSHELISQDSSVIRCVAISSCGNFAFVGCESGAIDIFNVQSGQIRKHFPNINCNPVICIGVDMANSYFVSIQSVGIVCYFEMASGRKKYEINLAGQVYKAIFHAESELLTIAFTSSHEIIIFDVQSQRIVRRFLGHTAQVTDLLISSDSRWLIASSQDFSICTWDIATGLLVDLIKLDSIPIAIAMPPSMKFLAVTMKNDLGIHLWTNLSLYQPISFDTNFSISPVKQSQQDELSEALIQLSLSSRQKFLNIYHLNEIKAKNKPMFLSKEPERAPFFLDLAIQKRTSNGFEVKQLANDENDPPSLLRDVELSRLLDSDCERHLDEIFSKLQVMSPSQTDFEIKSLVMVPFAEHDLNFLQKLILSVLYQLKKRKNWELAITYLNLILKAYQNVLVNHADRFGDLILETRNFLRFELSNLDSLLHKSLWLTSFSRDK